MLKPTMVIKDVCWDVTVKLKRLTEEGKYLRNVCLLQLTTF